MTELSRPQPSSIRYWEMKSASAGIICTTRIPMIIAVRPRKRNRERAKEANTAPLEANRTVNPPAMSDARSAGRKFALLNAVTKFSQVNSAGTRFGGQDMSSDSGWRAEFTIQYTGMSQISPATTPMTLASGCRRGPFLRAAVAAGGEAAGDSSGATAVSVITPRLLGEIASGDSVR